jgi:DNA polymerase III epsilon subunit family exonuclease
MSADGFTLMSVIGPGAAACTSSEHGDTPLVPATLADDEPGQFGSREAGFTETDPGGTGRDGRGREGCGPGLRPTKRAGLDGQRGNGTWPGGREAPGRRAELDGPELDGRRLNGAGLAERQLAETGLAGRKVLNGRAGLAEAGLAEAELSQLEFAVVDLETTGWSPGAAAITEIGAVRVRAGRQVGELVRQGEFASLVNPGVPVPPRIADLTGITDWMLAAAPRLGTVLPGLLDFARGCVLVAHNAPFDLGFLVAGCDDCGLAWPGFTVLDTVMLARHVMDPDEVPDCKLGTLAGFFGARTAPSHRALSDARATADVLGWLIRRLAHRGIRTLGQLSRWQDVVA